MESAAAAVGQVPVVAGLSFRLDSPVVAVVQEPAEECLGPVAELAVVEEIWWPDAVGLEIFFHP